MIFDINWDRVSDSQLKCEIENRKVIIWGAGQKCKAIIEVVGLKNIFCFFDNDIQKWQTKLWGIEIKKPEPMEGAVIITALEYYRHIIPQMKGLGFDRIYYRVREELYHKKLENYIEFYANSDRIYQFASERKFKYIHIFGDNKFFLPTVTMIEKAFSIEEHAFLIYEFNGPNTGDRYGNWQKYRELSEKYGSLMIADGAYNFRGEDMQKTLEMCLPVLNQCKQILFHGEWLGDYIREFFASERRMQIVKEKGVWFPWSGKVGTDLENIDSINKLLKYCKVIACSYDFMYQYLCRNIHMPKHYRLNNGLSYAWIVDRPAIGNSGRNVLLGQACFYINNNIESLNVLKKFKGMIDIYCIVSYGDEDCINDVVQKGEELFGDRFHAVTRFLCYPEFVEFINKMDVAVYGMDVAASFDTLQVLFWLNKKVYMKKGSDLDVMTKSYSYRISDFYQIERQTIEEFLSHSTAEYNYEISKDEFDMKKKIGQWRELFELDMDNIEETE